MAKITTWKFKMSGEWVEIGCYYTTKRKFSARGVPSDVEAMADTPFGGYDTEDELYREVQKAFAKYHEHIKRRRKVIAYKVCLSTDLGMIRENERTHTGFKSWVPESMRKQSNSFSSGINEDGFGFVISWKIWFEEKAKETIYYSISDDGSLGYERRRANRQIIEWTPERQAAFESIDAGLENMVKRLAKILGHSDRLIEAIDNGLKMIE